VWYLGGGDVDKIGELGTGETGRAAGDHVHVHVGRDDDLLEVVLQDLHKETGDRHADMQRATG
jgi:hypothetical protein